MTKDSKRKYDKDYRIKLRNDAILAYGGKCTCCNEWLRSCLQIDHLYGNGRRHQKLLGGSKALFIFLRDNKFPPGYQVLCANCNLGKFRNYGICPHKETRWPTNENWAYRSRANLRNDIFFLIGNRCRCCNISNELFLTIDHINGGGNKHRRSVYSNERILIEIRDNPSIWNQYQPLCMNCNIAKYDIGKCPHSWGKATLEIIEDMYGIYNDYN